jgi:hypothetical protein
LRRFFQKATSLLEFVIETPSSDLQAIGIIMEKTELSDFAPGSVGAESSQRPFSDSVRMCSKCCRKLDDGKTLRKAVKSAIKHAYGEDVELEKVDCFSLCPKGGQVLSTGANGSRRLVIIQPDSNVEMAVEYLLRA